MTLKERLIATENEDTVMIDGFDNAVLGITSDGCLIYDYYKMVDELVQRDGMEFMEAVEYIDYNTMRALPYVKDHRPIVLFPLLEI